MRTTPLFFGLCAGIVLTGTTAGFALGGYATGETSQGETSFAAMDSAMTNPDGSGTAFADGGAAADSADAHPESYKCHGCGPTLAERQMHSYAPDYDAQYASDYKAPDAEEAYAEEPVTRRLAGPPPYRPIPFDVSAPHGEAPVISTN
ncbi:MAG: hypothetical protein ABW192_06515 [Sphingobium sp.]